MPTRRFVCDAVGSGTRDNPFRSRINVVLAQNPEAEVAVRQHLAGAIGHAVARVTATAGLLAILAADPQIEILPAIQLDDRWDSWGTPLQRAALLNRLAGRGFDVTGIVASTLFRVLIRRLGQRFEPQFHEDRF